MDVVYVHGGCSDHIGYDKSGKWVITKFVKDHNHPLVVSPREARQTMVGSYFLSSCILYC